MMQNLLTAVAYVTSKCVAGSIGFICQPLGSVLSGIVLEPLGRKYSMLLVNVPHIIGWYLFYSASSLFTMFTAIIIMGLGKKTVQKIPVISIINIKYVVSCTVHVIICWFLIIRVLKVHFQAHIWFSKILLFFWMKPYLKHLIIGLCWTYGTKLVYQWDTVKHNNLKQKSTQSYGPKIINNYVVIKNYF